MQYTVERKEKSLFVVDNMYVWLMESNSPHIDPKLTIRSQSQGLHQALLPVLPSSTSLQKKIDYAWTFSLKHNDVAPVYNSLSLGGLGISLSQMTNSYRRKFPCSVALRLKEQAATNLRVGHSWLYGWPVVR